MPESLILSTNPFIQILPSELQEDCLTTKYYLPHFLENKKKLLKLGSLKSLEDYCLEITDELHYKHTYVNE